MPARPSRTNIALTIAGSDPSGGAGLQADLKTFHRFGVYGEAVVTLITAQNTRGVTRVETLRPALVAEQIQAVLEDLPPNAAKTGALGSREVLQEVARQAARFRFPLVVDPVAVSKHGAVLLDEGAVHSLVEDLLPHAFLLTPNLDEAEVLTGLKVRDVDAMVRAGEALLSMGARNVLVKGGHLLGSTAVDILLSHRSPARLFRAKRIDTPHTHGSGCTYSAAITALLAQGRALEDAVGEAKKFVTRAIRTAPQLGGGHGPLNHF